MANYVKKLMQEQIQKKINNFAEGLNQSIPTSGWIRTIRQALGMSSYILADRLGCDRSNVTAMEKREQQRTISLETLEQVAQAMNCKLVYSFVPLESLDKIFEKQARVIARQRIEEVNYSMKLEAQGLHPAQLQKAEDDLVQELLQGDPKNLWDADHDEL